MNQHELELVYQAIRFLARIADVLESMDKKMTAQESKAVLSPDVLKLLQALKWDHDGL